MKFRKRLLSCFLAVALLQGISSYLPLTVSAAQSEAAEAKLLQFTEGDFSFYEIYGKENEHAAKIAGNDTSGEEEVFSVKNDRLELLMMENKKFIMLKE